MYMALSLVAVCRAAEDADARAPAPRMKMKTATTLTIMPEFFYPHYTLLVFRIIRGSVR